MSSRAPAELLAAALAAADHGDDQEALKLSERALREAELSGNEPEIARVGTAHAASLLQSLRLQRAADLSAAIAERAADELGVDAPETVAGEALGLRCALGLASLGVRDPPPAEAAQRRSERVLGDSDPATVWLAVEVAKRGLAAGRGPDAGELVVAKAAKALGRGRELAEIRLSWALALAREKGVPGSERAERAAKQAGLARKALRRKLPDDHHLTLLARALQRLWEDRSARDADDPDGILATIAGRLGEQHPVMLILLGANRDRLIDLGRPAPALTAAAKLADACDERLGAHEPLTLAARDAVARIARGSGLRETAAEAGYTILEVRRRTLGASHPLSARTARLLADDLIAEGRLEAAEEVLEEAWAAISEAPAANAESARMSAAYSRLWELLGNNERAAVSAELGWNCCRRKLGPGDGTTLACRLRQANALCALERYEEAAEAAGEARRAYLDANGPGDELTLAATLAEAKALSGLNRVDEAVKLARPAWPLSLERPGEDSALSAELGAIFMLSASLSDDPDVEIADAERVWAQTSARELGYVSTYGAVLAANILWIARSEQWPAGRNRTSEPPEQDRELLLGSERKLAQVPVGSSLAKICIEWRTSNARALFHLGAAEQAMAAAEDLLEAAREWSRDDEALITHGASTVELLDELGRTEDAIPLAERCLAAERARADAERILIAEYELGRVLRNGGDSTLGRAVELLESSFDQCTDGDGRGPVDGWSLKEGDDVRGLSMAAALAIALLRRSESAARPERDIERGTAILCRAALQYDRLADRSTGDWLAAVRAAEWHLLDYSGRTIQISDVFFALWEDAGKGAGPGAESAELPEPYASFAVLLDSTWRARC